MSSDAPFDESRAPRFFSALMAGYSRRFRERFGDELRDVVAAMWADSRDASLFARTFLAVRLGTDIMLGIVADRMSRLLPPREPGRGIRRTRPPLPSFIDSALVDTRIAVRALGQHRTFALTVILTLGVGIGGVTAMWSVVYDVLLRPLPYANADRLVRVWNDMSARAGPRARYAVSSLAEIAAWQANAKTVDAIAGISITTRTVEGGDYAVRIPTGIVTENFFDMLGARAALGRAFRPGDGRDGANAVVVLSDEMWRTDFGADPAVIGRSIRVNGRPSEIIGVAPPGLRWLDRAEWLGSDAVRLWATRAATPNDHNHVYQVIARARPGVAPETIDQELGTIADRIEVRRPAEPRAANPASLVHVEPLYVALFGTVRERVLLPLAAVLLVLMLACANTANLLLSRLPARRAELAMRSALGASRVRLVRQLLTESLVLASAAAAAGVLIAYWSTRGIVALGPREIPRLDEVGVSGVALLVSVLTAATCAVVFGLVPAMRGSRVDLSRDLAGARGRPQGAGRERGRSMLLAGELAVALVLLVGATLVARSFGRLIAIDAGFDHEHTLMARVSLPAARYQEDLGPVRVGGRAVRFLPAWEQFISDLVQRVERDPRVSSATAAVFTPLLGSARGGGLEVEGADSASSSAADAQLRIGINSVEAGYFRTLRIPLLQGRLLNDRDRVGAPRVAVVSQSLAHRYWPGQSAVGRRFYWSGSMHVADSIWFERLLVEVVGVVGDTREAGYTAESIPRVYLPLYQGRSDVAHSSTLRGLQFTILVRAKQGDATPLEALIRREARAMDPQAPVSEVRTLDWLVNEEVRSPRFYAFLLSLFGSFAIVLAMAGVFGVLAFAVSQRTHEIGVRMALGAQPGAIVELVVRQVVVAAVVGVLGGVLLSRATTTLVDSLLFEVEPTDPASLTVSIALLVTAACVAAWVPARRAVRVDPALALRAD